MSNTQTATTASTTRPSTDSTFTRRKLLQLTTASLGIIGTGSLVGLTPPAIAADDADTPPPKGQEARFGLVTYQWGKDWELPTLIENCERAGVLGVELRTTHRHGVEPALTPREREEVRQRFDDSGIVCVGLGSDERYDNPDPAVVRKAIEATKGFLRLSHDIGASGVKVKPDSFHANVPREKTITQIGEALNELGEYAMGFGQQVRLEVHGSCAQLPTIKAIVDIAKHPQVALCWNCNAQDLEPPGLAHNFNLVAKRLGETTHIHRLDAKAYPHQELFELLVNIDYNGWLLFEEGAIPAGDLVAELTKQRELFEQMWIKAQSTAGK